MGSFKRSPGCKCCGGGPPCTPGPSYLRIFGCTTNPNIDQCSPLPGATVSFSPGNVSGTTDWSGLVGLTLPSSVGPFPVTVTVTVTHPHYQTITFTIIVGCSGGYSRGDMTGVTLCSNVSVYGPSQIWMQPKTDRVCACLCTQTQPKQFRIVTSNGNGTLTYVGIDPRPPNRWRGTITWSEPEAGQAIALNTTDRNGSRLNCCCCIRNGGQVTVTYELRCNYVDPYGNANWHLMQSYPACYKDATLYQYDSSMGDLCTPACATNPNFSANKNRILRSDIDSPCVAPTSCVANSYDGFDATPTCNSPLNLSFSFTQCVTEVSASASVYEI